MKKCYWCSKDMGEKDGNNGEKVFYSICDDCYSRLGLDERLPDLLWAIVDLRKHSSRGLALAT